MDPNDVRRWLLKYVPHDLLIAATFCVAAAYFWAGPLTQGYGRMAIPSGSGSFRAWVLGSSCTWLASGSAPGGCRRPTRSDRHHGRGE